MLCLLARNQNIYDIKGTRFALISTLIFLIASEPNLKVKSRLKAKVAEHRTIGSPLLHRPHRNGNKLHRSMTCK